ncbi:MAG: hypothetical protein FWH50_01700, partial [Coriobacteriia bacterium]|nr:hypothetical protein [Coriobacteriia bacterium]
MSHQLHKLFFAIILSFSLFGSAVPAYADQPTPAVEAEDSQAQPDGEDVASTPPVDAQQSHDPLVDDAADDSGLNLGGEQSGAAKPGLGL